jgi:hypothetical protein
MMDLTEISSSELMHTPEHNPHNSCPVHGSRRSVETEEEKLPRVLVIT